MPSRTLRCLGAILTLSSLATAWSQERPGGPQDPVELEVFVDGLMTAHLEAYHSVGATISVVKDGRIFFAKGYGYADRDSRERVRADRAPFRIGSVTKLFVWTAVMQLVERGKLELDEDINVYLTEGSSAPWEATW